MTFLTPSDGTPPAWLYRLTSSAGAGAACAQKGLSCLRGRDHSLVRVRDYVRSLPVFADVIRDFDADSLPDVPADLFGAWLRAAVEDGIPEPHA